MSGELVIGHPPVGAIVAPLLVVRRVLRQQFALLHKMVLERVRSDRLCRRLMTVPGVGPLVALTFRATVDQPRRFARSKIVGAHFGLVPRRFQSGETDYDGRISKCGDAMMRTALYEGSAGAPHTYLVHRLKQMVQGSGRVWPEWPRRI
jgi:transposase